MTSQIKNLNQNTEQIFFNSLREFSEELTELIKKDYEFKNEELKNELFQFQEKLLIK